MSHIKKMVTIQQVTRAKVIKLLGITPVQYADFLSDQAHAYLHDQLGESHIGTKLSKSSLFWAWWRNHWHDIDMEFLDEVKYMNLHERKTYYELLHDHKSFAYTPQKAIMLDAFKSAKNIIKHQL